MMSTSLYFAIMAILGLNYEEETGNFSYYLTNFVFIALSLIFIFGERFYKKVAPIRRINLLFYLLPIITCIIYLIESPIAENAYRYFSIYLSFSFPAIYIGTYVAANNSFRFMAKWFELTSIILTLGLIVSFPKIVFSRVITVGGALDYQTISYMAAFAYSFSLYSILFGDKYPRFKFLQSKIFSFITYFFVFFQIICVFITGGRGGFVVLLLTSLILLFLKLKRNIKIGRVILVIITIVLSLKLLSNILPQEVINLMQSGNERVFSYITYKGIDISETSGRDIYYSKAINLIKERPLLGYGIFKYVDTTVDYPHNIFLELLLQGGIFYFSFWIILLGRFYVKFKRILKLDNINFLLIPITIYPFTELLFSGSYLMSTFFWFVIAYVFNFNIKKVTSMNF